MDGFPNGFTNSETNLEFNSDTIIVDEVNDYFESAKNRSEMANWIIRAWFNPAKHGTAPWYAPVTTESVLKNVISNPKFPYTPIQLLDMWKNMSKIQKGLTVTTVDEDIATIEETIYKKGEATLSSIGSKIGDVTPTMVKKTGDQAEEKIKKLYGNVSPFSISSEDEEEIMDSIQDVREHAAVEFSNLLKMSRGDMKFFVELLIKNQILASTKEAELLSPEEIEGLLILYPMDSDVIEAILLEDIDEEENLFKTFQNAVSKRMFPPLRRGRPRKETIEI